jgi:hypothetical protein
MVERATNPTESKDKEEGRERGGERGGRGGGEETETERQSVCVRENEERARRGSE